MPGFTLYSTLVGKICQLHLLKYRSHDIKTLLYWHTFWHFHLEPCAFKTYDLDTIIYDKHSQMGHLMMKNLLEAYKIPISTSQESTLLFINYQSLDTEVSQRVKILDASSFIRAVGGNLGLFIGFSFLDSLLILCQWICNYLNSRLAK